MRIAEKPRYQQHFLWNKLNDVLLTVKVAPRDVVVKFSELKVPMPMSGAEKQRRNAKRSKIMGFSKRSSKRLRFLVRNSQDVWKKLIDLTYPEDFPLDGSRSKKHLNAFLQWLRRQKTPFGRHVCQRHPFFKAFVRLFDKLYAETRPKRRPCRIRKRRAVLGGFTGHREI